MLNGLLYLHGLSRTSAKVYIQLIGLKGSNRKYKRDDKMRALMPSDKSVPFLLEVLPWKKQKQHTEENTSMEILEIKEREMKNKQRKEQ